MSLRGRRWTGALEITTLGIIGDPDPTQSAIEATIMAAAAAGRLAVEVTVENGQTRVRAIAAPGPAAVPATTTRPALNRRAGSPDPGGPCHGQLILHDDMSTSCHSGRDDCWPGITAYRHAWDPIRCNTISHGCGTCSTANAYPNGERS